VTLRNEAPACKAGVAHGAQPLRSSGKSSICAPPDLMSGDARPRIAGARWGAALALSVAALLVFAWEVREALPAEPPGRRPG